MRKVALIVVLLLVTATAAQAQLLGTSVMPQEGGAFTGGMGVAVIDNQTYFAIHLQPELAFGKFGVGLDVNLLYNTSTGHIRSKDWDESYDYLRLIRYVRYAHKGDPFYVRVGALDAARLGHGFLVNYYSNSPSYDDRKIGIALDVDFGAYGFESFANNVARAEVLGGRVYWRPLRSTIGLPIIKNFELGATYVTDIDPDDNRKTDDGVSAFGLDAGLPLINGSVVRSMLYYDYGKIVDYGSGQAAGIGLDFRFPGGLAMLSARFERRWLGKEFEPNFFNAFYEVDRYTKSEYGRGVRKVDLLPTITEETKGYFGELYGRVLGVIQVVGNFVRLDDVKHSGVLHLAADAPDAVPQIAAHATYDKAAIETLEDVLTLDDRSVARVGLGYKIKPYLILYVDYIWNFTYNERTQRYEPQERIEPRLSFVYRFK
ncbi:MAG: hypothetical protein GXO73_01555 [Calditrichaeota bacterium]|nr:hypothetical protein [Calditrichota bacterium]